jgi:hypothetical protein
LYNQLVHWQNHYQLALRHFINDVMKSSDAAYSVSLDILPKKKIDMQVRDACTEMQTNMQRSSPSAQPYVQCSQLH